MQIVYIILIGIVLLLFSKKKKPIASGATGTWSLIGKPNVNRWRPEATAASQKTGIPTKIILGMIDDESKGNPAAIGTSGELGLMQLKTGAARDAGYKFVPLNPKDNILCGAKYLALQKSRYGKYTMFQMLEGYHRAASSKENIDYANRVLKLSDLYG